MKKLSLLAASINAGLFFGAVGSVSAFAAEEVKDQEQIEKIEITGSRIKRTDVEGPSPITILTSDAMKDQGFTNVYEAVQSLTSNTGSMQGQGYSGGFTQNAETVNLRGLGPNRTLVLLNGRRVANYPRPFNGQNNVFNLATIPFAAVDRIEIIAGGQSAIYGSDAMAGVMNIITKTDVDETTINVTATDTAQGGGEGQKLTLVTGGTAEKFSWTLALDYSNQEMLRGKDRQWLDDRYDTPANPEDYPSYFVAEPRTIMAMNYDYWTEGQAAGFRYLDPTECAAPTHESYRKDRGNYCSNNNSGFSSYINEREGVSAFLNTKYDLSDNHTVFADFLYWKSDARALSSTFYDTRFALESTGVDGNGYIYTESGNENNNNDGGIPTYIYMQRTFSLEEMGGINGASAKFEDEMYNITLGMEGTIFEDYNYNIFASYSQSDNDESEYKLTEEGASNYFIGTEEGHDIESGNYLAYLKMDNIFGALDEEGFNQIFDKNKSGGTAKVTNVGATITGDAVELPAGPIQFALTAEFSREEYEVNLHERTLNRDGKGWANLTGTEGSGDRDRSSIALELNIPLHETVNLSVAGRYDDYNDDTDVDGAGTYQVGLEWRPIEELLIRGSHATTFKAPDLHQVNAEPSGYFQGIEDDWLAAVCTDINNGGNGSSEGLPADAVASAMSTCSDANTWNPSYTVEGLRSGEKGLKEETGETSTIGFVWEVVEDVSWSVDYYTLELEDEVVGFPSTKLFEWEQECRNGTRDANSGTCQNIVDGFIERAGYSADNPSPVGSDLKATLISASYINAAKRKQKGIESEFSFTHEFDNYGEIGLLSRYTHVLEYERQFFEGDETDEDYREVQGGDFRSKLNSSFTWMKDDWRITLEQLRYGSTTNDPDPGDFTETELRRLKPWLIYNLGVNYQINDDQRIRLGVNNVRDSRPRSDASFNGAPYFDNFLYPTTVGVMGRTYSLEYEIIL